MIPYDRREREDERDFEENYQRSVLARRREFARSLGLPRMMEALVAEFGKQSVQEALDACEEA